MSCLNWLVLLSQGCPSVKIPLCLRACPAIAFPSLSSHLRNIPLPQRPQPVVAIATAACRHSTVPVFPCRAFLKPLFLASYSLHCSWFSDWYKSYEGLWSRSSTYSDLRRRLSLFSWGVSCSSLQNYIWNDLCLLSPGLSPWLSVLYQLDPDRSLSSSPPSALLPAVVRNGIMT